jgi:hypothetical protein
MVQRPEDKAREWRIENEIVVDCYNEEERVSGWYCYLDDRITFPFTARCIRKMRISPLEVGEEVEVSAIAPEEEEMHSMFVLIRWHDRELGVPLAQLEAVGSDPETAQAVEDWRYWMERGYEF